MTDATPIAEPASVTVDGEQTYLGLAVAAADGRLMLNGWRRVQIDDRFVFGPRSTWSWALADVRVVWLTEERVAA